MLFLIGLSSAQLFQFQTSSQRVAPGPFVVARGSAAWLPRGSASWQRTAMHRSSTSRAVPFRAHFSTVEMKTRDDDNGLSIAENDPEAKREVAQTTPFEKAKAVLLLLAIAAIVVLPNLLLLIVYLGDQVLGPGTNQQTLQEAQNEVLIQRTLDLMQ